MASKHILVTLEPAMYNVIERKAKNLGFKDAQQYTEAFLRRSARGPVRKPLAHFDTLVSKFAKPTKKTYKILRNIKVVR
ncbi:MAG TPA: hypothetical protein VJK03_03565 [Candidatus Nanoarchaeia archaeon]|nr:hypothetical protein [Candidatus Nanoarchaeia archaeon]